MLLSVTEPGEGAYSLGYLPSETDVQFYWDITSAMPMIDPMRPIQIMGTGMDAAGDTVEFGAISEGIDQ